MKRTQIYEATDGRTFETAAKCKEHEDSLCFKTLAGLSLDDIARAINRDSPEVADAFERVGNMIAEKRRADGHVKRRPKPAPAAFEKVETAMRKGKGEA